MSETSKLLIDEAPLVVLPSLANLIGLNEAIVLQQIHYWINTFKKAKKDDHFQDEEWWVYGTFEDWHKDNFTWWSVRTIKRIFANLKEKGVLIAGRYNKSKIDRTLWYRINYAQLEALVSPSIVPTCHDVDSAKLSPSIMPTWHDQLPETTETNTERVKAPRPVTPDPLRQSMSSDVDAYIAAWRNAHTVPPLGLRGNKRLDAIDDVKELRAMGCTPDDLAAFTKERQNNGKSTAWHFLVQDIHTYMVRKAPAPVIEVENPTTEFMTRPVLHGFYVPERKELAS